jgi:hypothetical protein
MADRESLGADHLPALGAEMVIARSGPRPEPRRATNVSMLLQRRRRDLALDADNSGACAILPLPSDSRCEVGR